MYPLILASASPRRREIFTMAGFEFKVVPAVKDEPLIDRDLPVDKAVIEIAQAKAAEVSEKYPDCAVVGADTVVSVNGEVLGKPHDEAHAEKMLKTLNNNTHTVFTGVYVIDPEFSVGFSVSSKVVFNKMTDTEINGYIKTGEPMDKAGAYGIQGYGMRFIKEINGDFFNVMGFPMVEFYNRYIKLRG